MLSESENATGSQLARPIIVDSQASSSVNNLASNEVFNDAVDYNLSSEDEEYVDANDGEALRPVQGTSEATDPVSAPIVQEENASSSTTQQLQNDIGNLNINNLRSNVDIPPVSETRIHNIHPQQNIIGDVLSGVRTRNQIRNNENAGLYAEIRESGQQNDWSFSCYVSQEEPLSLIHI